jgi:tRNA1Val (adenine37-N6)-methyltransferase
MKVCTDACLFGAWAGSKLTDTEIPGSAALDIGAGTALLSLMIVQQLQVTVSAVELNKDSFEQARENVRRSKWAGQINVVHADILQYQPEDKYGLVLSNPPFFQNDLKSGNPGKNLARHEQDLNLQGLFSVTSRLLSPGGYFALLLPANRKEQALEIARNTNMHLRYTSHVRQTAMHTAFREMFIFSTFAGETEEEEIIIKSGTGYSDRFVHLLQPFYLYL